MQTLGDMAKALNRSPVYLRVLQTRFELPVVEGAAYASAYLAEYIPLFGRIRSEIAAELPHLREAAKWTARVT